MRRLARSLPLLWALAMAATLAPGAGGCAKRAWVAEHGTGEDAWTARSASEAREAAPDTTRVAAAGAAYDPFAARAMPGPEVSGAAAIAAPLAQVSEELPWLDEGETSGSASTVDCALGPCHWVQVAAPLDSQGCAGVLARAMALAGAAGAVDAAGTPVPVSGRIRAEAGAWKVQVGPFVRWNDADLVRVYLRRSGFPDAWLVRR